MECPGVAVSINVREAKGPIAAGYSDWLADNTLLLFPMFTVEFGVRGGEADRKLGVAAEVVGVYNKRERRLSEIYHFKYVERRVGRERMAVVMSCRRKIRLTDAHRSGWYQSGWYR
jgi:hypothetical protein